MNQIRIEMKDPSDTYAFDDIDYDSDDPDFQHEYKIDFEERKSHF